MSSAYNNKTRHISHAEQIINALHADYPDWVTSGELIELTQSRNIQARLQAVRSRYGDAVEVMHLPEEAAYRLDPNAPEVADAMMKRIFIPADGLTAEDVKNIRAFADSLRLVY